ncbi:MAG: SocA family protein [Prevotellaceae bacterium]|jgi:uncharacterized phage-associated protein|nr:SocA family protein [Prevotellaceae bacterium]
MANYSKNTINKIGNAIVYIASRVNDLSKTKLLKLLYKIEKHSVVKHQTPFFGITFYAWQFGPVAKDIFIDLSNDEPILFSEFISTEQINDNVYIQPKTNFNDDEFSDNDINIMDEVIAKYGNKTANEISESTHKVNSAWHNTAVKNNLLKLFRDKKINHSEVEIDLSYYLSGCDKERYLETKEIMQVFE